MLIFAQLNLSLATYLYLQVSCLVYRLFIFEIKPQGIAGADSTCSGSFPRLKHRSMYVHTYITSFHDLVSVTFPQRP